MGERSNQASLKLKATTYTNDPKLFAKVIRSYPNTKDLNTMNYALEGFELFGSTKWTLDLLPNTTRACIEESFNHDENMVSHAACLLEHSILSHIGIFLNCLLRKERVSGVASQY